MEPFSSRSLPFLWVPFLVSIVSPSIPSHLILSRLFTFSHHPWSTNSPLPVSSACDPQSDITSPTSLPDFQIHRAICLQDVGPQMLHGHLQFNVSKTELISFPYKPLSHPQISISPQVIGERGLQGISKSLSLISCLNTVSRDPTISYPDSCNHFQSCLSSFCLPQAVVIVTWTLLLKTSSVCHHGQGKKSKHKK